MANYDFIMMVWNKNKNKFTFDQSGLKNTFTCFYVWLFRTREISHLFYPD